MARRIGLAPDAPGRRATDPVPMSELHRLEQTAEKGESDKTPWIVLSGVWVVCAIAVVVLLGLTALAVYIAT